MEVRVLGPIEVHNGHRLAIGGPRQRRILAALAMHPGEVVSLDRLADKRIEVPNPGDWISGQMMGEWLFVTRDDGSFLRVHPSTFETIGEPILNPAGSLGYGKLDDTNLRVAGAGARILKVWDLETGRQLGRDLPYRGGASRYEFSSDGTGLSVPEDDRVTLWNFDTDTWADLACEMAGRNLTQDEWDQFGPRNIDRRPTCPEYPLE